jgi:hypothetical protein
MISSNKFFEVDCEVGRGESIKRALQLFSVLSPENPTIVETGTARGKFGGGYVGDGWATVAFGWYAKKFGGTVHTVDIDDECINECMRLTADFSDHICYHVQDSVEFLNNFDGNIDFLYLDSFDCGSDPELNIQAADHMLNEYKASKQKLTKTSLILLDDIGVGFNTGKGVKLVPQLLRDGWYMIYHDTTRDVNQALFCRHEIMRTIEELI